MVAFVYIVSGDKDSLRVDVTLSLMQAMWGHKTGTNPDRSSDRLVYFERCHNIRDAYARKDELSATGLNLLQGLIERRNPGWLDLSAAWFPVEIKGAIVQSRPRRTTVH